MASNLINKFKNELIPGQFMNNYECSDTAGLLEIQYHISNTRKDSQKTPNQLDWRSKTSHCKHPLCAAQAVRSQRGSLCFIKRSTQISRQISLGQGKRTVAPNSRDRRMIKSLAVKDKQRQEKRRTICWMAQVPRQSQPVLWVNIAVGKKKPTRIKR